MSRRPAVVAAGLVLVVVLGLYAVPWLLRDRTFVASTPTVRPLQQLTDVDVPAGERACLEGGVLFEPSAKAARFQVRTDRDGGPPLVVEARAPGYRSETRVRGGYRDTQVLDVPLRAADRERPDGALCIRNAGREPVGIVATTESRYYAPLLQTVAGKQVEAQMAVTLIDPEPASLLGRLGAVADHVAAFRPGWIGRWFLYPLLLAALLGIPALVLFALARASAEEPGGR